MKSLILASALIALASSALADPVSLKLNPVDEDGRVTLGEIFDGAGMAASAFIAERAGPSVVLQAGQLQALALRNGLHWANPQGLRRVVVRQASAAPAPAASAASRVASRPGTTIPVLTYARNLATGDIIQPEDLVWSDIQAHQAPSGSPQDADLVIGLSARRPLRAGAAVGARDLASPQVIARNDMVEVSFVSGGIRLTVTGKATRDASLGESVPVMNTSSNRLIDAVATGPGRAVAGPASRNARAAAHTYASR